MKKILFAAVLTAVCGAASAQGYAGALIGMSQYNVDCEGVSCDKSDTATKIVGGYTVAPNIAIEAGYINFGEFSGSDSVISLKLKSTAFFVGGAFRSEFSPEWTGVARLGIASVKTKAEASALGSSGSQSDTKASLYAGLGVEYGMTSDIKLVGAWDFTRFEVNGEDGSLHSFTVGAQIGF